MTFFDSFANGMSRGIGYGVGNSMGKSLEASGWMPTVILIIGAYAIASAIKRLFS